MDTPIERHEAVTFLTLPLEIRREIYKAALKRGSIHFQNIEDQPSNTYTYSIHSRQELWSSKQDAAWKARHKLCRAMSHRNLGDCPDRLFIGILYTCRQVHAEASQILWSKNTFRFGSSKKFTEIIPEIGQWNRAALRNFSLTVPLGNIYDMSAPGPGLLAIPNPILNLGPLLNDLQGLRALRMELICEVHRFGLSHAAARYMSDVLNSLSLETVEIILMHGRYRVEKEDREGYLNRIEKQLMEGFTSKLNEPSYWLPRIMVMWESEL
ncbi:MAG: hypothetical protein HETSPECPRED_002424 [Heterodermia speciosa]|uniref:DUF7730 domain-containing protein n=1 Tax=Heterodermia speciosa TaxID=116794 RepID=A0A8H3J4C3_9LECA|nr:MAG: hypothetical protein HETSPECPRED_002424 [Heterodermia speciosa]